MLLSYKQYGFRIGKSTEDALLSFISEVYYNFKHNCTGLFIDIDKAFDL